MAQQLVEQGVLQTGGGTQVHAGVMSCRVAWAETSRELTTEVYKANLAVGDTLLLCTDGLTTRMDDDNLIAMLRPEVRAEETCRRLVAAANEAGGRITLRWSSRVFSMPASKRRWLSTPRQRRRHAPTVPPARSQRSPKSPAPGNPATAWDTIFQIGKHKRDFRAESGFNPITEAATSLARRSIPRWIARS